MRKVLLLASLGLFFSAIPVHAALVGEFDQANLNNALNGTDATANVFSVCANTLCDLGTTVVINGGSVFQYKNNFYYTNSTGFQKKNVSSAAGQPTTIRTGARLNTVGAFGPSLVVSNQTVNTSGQHGSFLYDASSSTTTNFSPRLGKITELSFSRDGKEMVMIAKNVVGQKKLFISQSSLNALKEFPLPQYATDCYTVGVSPSGHSIVLGCDFKLPGATSDSKGSIIMHYLNGLLTAKQRVNNKQDELVKAEWISNNKLITLTDNASGSSTIHEIHVCAGSIIDKEVVAKTLTTPVGGGTLVALPFSIQARAPSFFYGYLDFLVSSNGDSNPVASTIGSYQTTNRVDTVISSGLNFRMLIGH